MERALFGRQYVDWRAYSMGVVEPLVINKGQQRVGLASSAHS